MRRSFIQACGCCAGVRVGGWLAGDEAVIFGLRRAPGAWVWAKRSRKVCCRTVRTFNVLRAALAFMEFQHETLMTLTRVSGHCLQIFLVSRTFNVFDWLCKADDMMDWKLTFDGYRRARVPFHSSNQQQFLYLLLTCPPFSAVHLNQNPFPLQKSCWISHLDNKHARGSWEGESYSPQALS